MPNLDERKVLVVVFSDADPGDPKNWTTPRKFFIVSILCCLSFCAVFGSSAYAPAEGQIRQLYGVNGTVASTGLSLYVLGFAFGPLLWGPMSEMYGRRLPYLISWPLLIVSIVPTAWVENITVILLFRFFTGCFASCALNNGGGVITDMYGSTPRTLAKAIGWYAFCPLSGPCFGSIVGFFVAAHSGRGLWVARVHWFFVISLWPLLFFLPETHGPTILRRRADKLRKDGETAAYTAQELVTQSTRQILAGHIGRPAAMLINEPINQGAAIWISLAYSIIYFFFEAYPVVFIQQNHIPFELGGLPFLGITVGMTIAVTTYPLAARFFRRVHIPFIEAPGGTPEDAPEAQVKVVLLGCGLMPVSMFWFAWTSGGNVHWVVPTLAGVPFGYSMLCIFYSFSAYTAQTYSIYASSAQAGNTFVRSLIAAGLAIAAHFIVGNLGTKWGISLFGFLSLGLIPIPIIFIRYGSVLRQKSRLAQEAATLLKHMRQVQVVETHPVDEKAVSEDSVRDATCTAHNV